MWYVLATTYLRLSCRPADSVCGLCGSFWESVWGMAESLSRGQHHTEGQSTEARRVLWDHREGNYTSQSVCPVKDGTLPSSLWIRLHLLSWDVVAFSKCPHGPQVFIIPLLLDVLRLGCLKHQSIMDKTINIWSKLILMGWNIGSSIKGLPCKHKDLSLIPWTCI